MTWTGGCLCGAVRYQAEADPMRAVICHCVTCRRVSGAPMMCFVHFPAEAFRWYVDLRRYGSEAQAHEARLGDSLDTPERARPDDHVWTKQQLPWLRIEDDLPRFPTTSAAVPSRAVEERS